MVALSGGVDSTVLLHVLLRLLGRERLVAMHVNHMLRGDDALRDQEFVEDLCVRLGIDLEVEQLDVPRIARERGLGVEEAARFARRGALLAQAQALGVGAIATGHNLNDHVETMILKLVQGTGLRGLQGILPRQGAFVRPLLSVHREDILNYACRNELSFVEDRTNLDERHLRNWVRHKVLPLLSERNPNIISVANGLSQIVREHLDLAEDLAEEAWNSISSTRDGVVLKIPGLMELHPTLQRLVVMRFLKEAFPGHRMSRSHVLQVLELASSNNGSMAGVPGGTVVREGELLRPCPIPVRQLPKSGVEAFEPYFLEREGDYWWGRWNWKVYFVDGKVELPVERGVVLSSSKVSLPLLLRCRRPGDRIYRRGVGHKSVSKIMREKGIPPRERDTLPLLVDPSENRVLWVAELGADPLAMPTEGEPALVVERKELL